MYCLLKDMGLKKQTELKPNKKQKVKILAKIVLYT